MSGPPALSLQRTRLRLPIRLKLAVVSAGLTFVILLLFADRGGRPHRENA